MNDAFLLKEGMILMRITVLTIFPELFEGFHAFPLVKRALENGSLELVITDMRAYADGSYRHIDDSPYGGGAGMILRYPVMARALADVRSAESHTVLFAASGHPYTQKDARRFAESEDLILVCGHYEGIDARILDDIDEEISVGDYVLSGGELPAMTVIDSIVRLLDGTIRTVSTEEESFENGLLEYPQYTRPASWNGRDVPSVLLSGNHEQIRLWRKKESLKRTLLYRPDLLEKYPLSAEESRMLAEVRAELNGKDKK